MKILQIIPALEDGGAERFVVDLCNELSNAHEVTLCLFFKNKKETGFQKELLPDIKLISLDKKPGFDISIIFKLKKVLNNYKPDIVHTHVGALIYLLATISITFKKYKIVHTIHNDAWKEVRSKKERQIRYWFYRKKKIIPVTISKESDRTFKQAYPDVASTIIYNGTRKPATSLQFDSVKKFIENARKNDNTKIFVHIGRLEYQKNHVLLIAAFQKLLKSGANALLIMIGGERNQAESHQISQAIQEACNTNQNMIWLGGNQPAIDYLLLADFFCLSSLFEGMPISLIEAFATGCIPVCTPVGGIPEMMNGKKFIAKNLSIDAYYNALKEAYVYPTEKLSSLKNEFIALFNEKHTMNFCGYEYEKLYKQLLAKNGM